MQPSPQFSDQHEQLLRSALQAARQGRTRAARALLVALSEEAPNDLRIWLALAKLAPSEAEQRAALDRAYALQPDHPAVLRARAARPMTAAVAALPDDRAVPPAADLAAPSTPQAPSSRATQPLSRGQFALIGLALLLGAILGWLFLPQLRTLGPTAAPAPSTSLPPTNQPSAVPAATNTLAPAANTSVSTAPALTPTPTPLPPTPTPTPEPILSLGMLLEYDNWSATLIRPEYAVAVDGPIGALQPEGRFVFALIAIGNLDQSPRRLPSSLFALVDAEERRYAPLVGASTAYLDLFGRGQRGDAALEEEIDPNRGLVSVPLIFDVPREATELRLTFGPLERRGWPIEASTLLSPSQQFGP